MHTALTRHLQNGGTYLLDLLVHDGVADAANAVNLNLDNVAILSEAQGKHTIGSMVGSW